MTTNKYFNNFSYAREQDLIEDLNIEAIKGINLKNFLLALNFLEHY